MRPNQERASRGGQNLRLFIFEVIDMVAAIMNLSSFFQTGSLCLLAVLHLSQPLAAQVRITEVNLATKTVELTNFGTTTQDLSSWFWCHRFSYPQPGGSLAARETKQYSISTLNTTSSDLCLYNSGSFGSASAMQDFVQWGGGGIGRESVAVAKGIWATGAFLALPASGMSFHSKGSNVTGSRVGNWFVGRPHAGFPVPDMKVNSLALVNGEWRLQIASFFLANAHTGEVRNNLSSAWVPQTTTRTDLGNGLFELRFSAGGGPRQFAQIKASF
jgi:hypothetical protein